MCKQPGTHSRLHRPSDGGESDAQSITQPHPQPDPHANSQPRGAYRSVESKRRTRVAHASDGRGNCNEDRPGNADLHAIQQPYQQRHANLDAFTYVDADTTHSCSTG